MLDSKDRRISKTNPYKIKISQWAETSTIHAIPNISRTKNPLVKIIWLISFICGACLSFYMTVTSIQNYLEFNVVSKIRVVDEAPISFPTVSICNLSPFVTQKASDFIKPIIESSDFKSVIDLDFLDNYQHKTKIKYISKIYKIQTIVAGLNDSIKKDFGYDFNTFVLSCLYKSLPCDRSDFVWYYDAVFGNCYRFNTGKYENGSTNKLKTLNKVGYLNGLMLDLYVGDDNAPLPLAAGAVVYIHSHTVVPATYEGFTTMNIGTATNILISKTYTNKLPYPYSECREDLSASDSYLYNKVIEVFGTYRRTDCLNFCFQRKVIEICSCYDITYRSISSEIRPCSSLNETTCVYNTLLSFAEETTNKLCSNECPLECESISYSQSTSTSSFPPRSYADDILNDTVMLSRFDANKKIDYNFLKEHLLSVNIYFDALQSTRIEEFKQVEFFDLIANIGGTLGLFIGISLLSFVELVELILELAFVDRKKIDNLE